ncbi:hypothetical protein [Microbulbifer sp. SAOS-129_SWC]|uniref:hypothetical protein n=1 Tax=Microbulbifer sp. SAOS-129_SWC TaxID=3145235 RepID=UPI0032171FC5
MRTLALIIFLFPMLFSVGCQAGDESGVSSMKSTNTSEVASEEVRFFQELRARLASSDVDWISLHINYPLGVYVDGVPTVISGKKELVAKYERIFNKWVMAAVACQDVGGLKLRPTGVMVGQGEIWFSKTKDSGGDFRIIKINNEPWPEERGRKDAECYFKKVQ